MSEKTKAVRNPKRRYVLILIKPRRPHLFNSSTHLSLRNADILVLVNLSATACIFRLDDPKDQLNGSKIITVDPCAYKEIPLNNNGTGRVPFSFDWKAYSVNSKKARESGEIIINP
jgi:hypothetical protein